VSLTFEKPERRDSQLTVRIKASNLTFLKKIAKKHDVSLADVLERMIEEIKRKGK
jgi:hypothetical protein